MNVLLVTGDLALVDAMTAMLDQARSGFALTRVATLAGAVEHLGATSFDVAFVDLDLPEADARAVVGQLPATCRDVPVIVLVGADDHALALDALAAGVQDYLVKGRFDSVLLEHSLRHSIERHRRAGPALITTEDAIAAGIEERERGYASQSAAQLAGGIAHDFNNLLGAVLTYVTLLERHCDDAVALADLAEIRAAAERALDVTRQLLVFAAPDIVDASPLDLTAVIRDSLGLVRRALGEHIDLHLELSQRPVITRITVREVEHILLNLASNAREAMPDGGVVTISANAPTQLGREVFDAVLLVSDTGVGMSSDDAARAIEPFFTTKPQSGGVGLGLATVYGIVRQNLGDMTITSTEAGTEVTIRLPGADDEVVGADGVVRDEVAG